MKMKSALLVLSVLMTSGSLAVLSEYARAADSSSGCGLGWQVTQRQSLLSSAVRSTTNTVLPNTFSMTSGTSGCAKHEIVKNDEKAVIYAVNNYDSLIVEMSKGQGEFLAAFAETLGCTGNQVLRFSEFTRANYRPILEESTHDGIELYRAVRSRMLNSAELSAQCSPQA